MHACSITLTAITDPFPFTLQSHDVACPTRRRPGPAAEDDQHPVTGLHHVARTGTRLRILICAGAGTTGPTTPHCEPTKGAGTSYVQDGKGHPSTQRRAHPARTRRPSCYPGRPGSGFTGTRFTAPIFISAGVAADPGSRRRVACRSWMRAHTDRMVPRPLRPSLIVPGTNGPA